MHEKGRAFKGLAAGKYYNGFAKIFGMRSHFYKHALGKLHLTTGMTAVDLGCGTGLFTKALANASAPDTKIIGIDLSDEQISHAEKTVAKEYPQTAFQVGSMDELPFKDKSIDIITTLGAVHEVPQIVAIEMLNEVRRVIKDEGLFLFIDIAKPKFGLSGIFWAIPMYLKSNIRDHMKNPYADLLQERGFIRLEDRYVNSVTRRQLFKKNNHQAKESK